MIIDEDAELCEDITTYIDEINPDKLMNLLEKTVGKSIYIYIKLEKTLIPIQQQAIAFFVVKYQNLIEYCTLRREEEENFIYVVKFKSNNFSKSCTSYSDLMQKYDSSYYLSDCGGYKMFLESKGTRLEGRLEEVLFLVSPSSRDNVLDIGCGRGELAYKMSAMGANVTAIDYSEDAIDIAKKTYGNGIDNLEYLCEDIFKKNFTQKYDKVVLADIVEHIEQPMLEELIKKVKDLLTPEGLVIIHTAPNKDYYDLYYPQIVEAARQLGCFLPQNPRSYYEQLMHINEQTPESLAKLLKKYFKYIKLWTGGIDDYLIEKTSDEMMGDNNIFCLAANSDIPLQQMNAIFDSIPNLDRISLQLESDIREYILESGSQKVLQITVKNIGSDTVYSVGRNPIHVSYHIYDQKNEVLIWDGLRSDLSGRVLSIGEKQNCLVKL